MPAPEGRAAPASPPRRAGWHIAGSVAAWALPLAAAIAAMPFMWRTLGRDGYGIYVLAAGYAGLAGSLGSVRGAAQRVAAAGSSPAALPAAVGGAYLAAAASGTVALVAAAALAPVFLRLAGLDPDASPATLTAFRLAGATAPAFHLTQAARGVCIGLERYGMYSGHVTATTVLTTIGTVMLAAEGYEAPGLMAWQVVASLVSAGAAIALAQLATRATPALSWPDGRAIFRFGATVVVTETILTLYVLAERTLLTRAMGVGAVAELTIPLSLASALQNALAAGAVVLLPRAGAAWALGDVTALRTMYARAVKVIVLVAMGGSAALAGSAATLIGWWIDPAFAAQTSATVIVLLAAFATNAVATPIWSLVEGAGRPARNTAFAAGLALIGVTTAAVLAPRFGAPGIASARACAMLSVPLFVLLGERALFGRTQSVLWSAVTTRIISAMVVLVAALAGAQQVLTGVPLLLANGALAAAFGAWHWHSNYFDSAEKQAVQRLLGARLRP